MSEILKESEKFKELTQTEEQEKTAQGERPPDLAINQEQPASQPQPENTTISQPDNTILSENNNIIKPKRRKTDERDKKLYYLDPGQTDKLDDLRREYKQRTGKKLNEQDFMRHIVNKLTIDMLL